MTYVQGANCDERSSVNTEQRNEELGRGERTCAVPVITQVHDWELCSGLQLLYYY